MSMVNFSIFDHEEVEEAGQETEFFCPRCKTETLHTVIEDEEEETKQVRCSTCEHVHAMRAVSEEEEEPASKKKSSKAKPAWEQVIERNKKEIKHYHINDLYTEMEIISHPTFGLGFVSDLIGYDKMEVTFQDAKRILVHNRLGKQITLPSLLKTTEATGKLPLMEGGSRKDADVDELLDLEEDILLGNSTKLSPEAWAALQEEDELEEDPMLKDEDELDSFDEESDTRTSVPKKKTKSTPVSSKTKPAPKQTHTSSTSKSAPTRRGKTRQAS